MHVPRICHLIIDILRKCFIYAYHTCNMFKHDLTFCAQSCTAHQMKIFAQEFEPASYFCDWT